MINQLPRTTHHEHSIEITCETLLLVNFITGKFVELHLAPKKQFTFLISRSEIKNYDS